MDQVKSAVGATAALRYLQGGTAPLDQPLVPLLGPHRPVLTAAGLLTVAALTALAALQWLTPPARTFSGPLGGIWNCSLAGQPIGPLTIDGWNYVLGSTEVGGRAVGTIDAVDYPAYGGKGSRFATKYHEKILKVEGGTLGGQYGVKLGFHFKIAGEPEMLVFNIGPASGIRCVRP